MIRHLPLRGGQVERSADMGGRKGASGALPGLLVSLSFSLPPFPSCLIQGPLTPTPSSGLSGFAGQAAQGSGCGRSGGSSGRLVPKKRMDREDHPNSAPSQLSLGSSRGDPFHDC